MLVAGSGAPRAVHAADVRYSRDVRPILADNCFACHGPDETSREAGLRLDTLEGQRDSGAVVPGDVAASLLVERIDATDPELIMPPPHSKKQLSDAQKDILRRWIADGAPVEGHWAFEPPSLPTVPTVARRDWVRNPIDAFVLETLEARGIAPSAEASRRTLIRRITLDLTGIPPTPEEVAAFCADPSPDAYERLVDRLLASPRFGERFAQIWLDVSRYADTNGYNNDEERVMWRWRDWVIEAFNRNLPYDAFVRQQLAGDQLPNPTLEQRIATGFNRNHVLTTEGGIIDEEYRVEYVADRVQTTFNVLLGLTLQCARCHDHKYDPISQREYFQLFAFFNQSPDKVLGYNQGAPATPYIKAPTREQQWLAQQLEQQRADIDAQLAERRMDVKRLVADWEASLEDEDTLLQQPLGLAHHFPFEPNVDEGYADQAAPQTGVRRHGKPTLAESPRGHALVLDGQSWLEAGQSGEIERDEPFSISLWVYRTSDATGAVLSKMHDSSAYRGYDLLIEEGRPTVHLIHKWPDNAIKVKSVGALPLNEWTHLGVTYDGSSRAAGVKIYIDGQPQELETEADSLRDSIRTEWSFHIGRRGESLTITAQLDELQLFRRELNASEIAQVAAGQLPMRLADVLNKPVDQRSALETRLVEDFYLRQVDLVIRELTAEQAELADKQAELERAIPTALVMEDQTEPRATYVLERGEYDKPGDEVSADVPASLPAWSDSLPRNRLGLAEWILDREHPLTARVAVNRWWAALFGTGLVETEEDFGIQGALPSHPALLDWLAYNYSHAPDASNSAALNWDTKALLRLIVTSSTYRQTSDASAELLELDPHNRLLARGARFRLPAEQVRDTALAVSGLLVERQGGPSVRPYQPEGLWEEVSVERREKYVPSSGAGLYRRSLYTFWKRTCPPPGMTVFDAPDREFCVIRRARTNTPLQALALMNDPTYVEAARHLAERVLLDAAGKDFEEQLQAMFERVLARPAQLEEVAEFQRLFEEAQRSFREDPHRAERLLSVGESGRNEQLDAQQHAAWTVLASLLLNLDETLNRE